MNGKADFTILYHKKDLLWLRWIDCYLRSRGFITKPVDFTSGRVRNIAEWALLHGNESCVAFVLESDEMFSGGVLAREWEEKVTPDIAQFQVVFFRRKGLTQPKLSGTFHRDTIGAQEHELQDNLSDMLGKLQLRNINRDKISAQFNEEMPIYPGLVPRNFLMPYARPSKFFGRFSEFGALEKAIGKQHAVLIRNKVGGRGFGLSSMLTHYIYTYIERFSTVWWIPAHDPLLMADALKELGARFGVMGLPGDLLTSWPKIAMSMAGKSKLPFMVILDRPNIHTMKEWESLADKPWKSGVLVALAGEPQRENVPEVGVGMMSREECLEMISATVGDGDAANYDDLVAFLKQHPLLLRMASRILKGGKSMERYMEDFQLEQNLVKVPELYLKPFMINLRFVIDQLQFANPDAEKLLVFGAYFAALPIPACMFEPSSDADHQLEALTRNPKNLSQCINLLEEYGVITKAQETFVVHPLIAQCIHAMDSYRKDWPDVIIRTLSEKLSPTLPAETLEDRRGEVYPHAVQMCLQRVRQNAITEDSVVLINNIANEARALQNIPVALELLQGVMKFTVSKYGENHVNVSGLAINLGLIYKLENKLDEALSEFERALRIDTSVLGASHINVAEDHKQIARLHEQRKAFTQANSHYEKAVDITRESLGDKHPRYARLLADYIPVLKAIKLTSPIYQYAKTVVEIEKATYGADSPKLSQSLAVLGSAAAEEGNFHEAMQSLGQSMALEEKIYGPNHPKIAVRLGQLANILEKTGDKKAALEKYQTAHSIFNVAIGADHPSTKILAECVARLKG